MSVRKKRGTNNVCMIAFDMFRFPEYQGPCEVVINTVSSVMLVEPKLSEEFKTKSIPFKWTFVLQKNAIFVAAEDDKDIDMDFILIFGTDQLSEKVYNKISEKKVLSEEISIVDRFMINIFQKIAENPSLYTYLIENLVAYFCKLDAETQKEYRRLMKESGMDDIVACEGGTSEMKLLESSDLSAAKIPNFVLGRNTKKSVLKGEVIPKSLYELHKNKNGEENRKLVVFTSEKKDLCYVYYYSRGHKQFTCTLCGLQNQSVGARLLEKLNGEVYLQTNGKKHVCKPRKFDSILGIREELIPESMFTLHSNAQGVPNRRIMVFTSEKKDICYNLNYRSFAFVCYACERLKKPAVYAKLLENESGEKYLKTNGRNHSCQPRKYVAAKRNDLKPSPKIIPDSMFELHDSAKGEKNKKLIVFSSESKDLCWAYCYLFAGKMYRCSSCEKKNMLVSAKFKINEFGERYLETNGKEHVCVPKRKTEYGMNDIVACLQERDTSEIELSESSDLAVAKIPNVVLGQDTKKYKLKGEVIPKSVDELHKAKKPSPKIIPDSMFELHDSAKGEKNKKLIVYSSESKDLCWAYCYLFAGKMYRCSSCEKKRMLVTAKFKIDEFGERYLETNGKEHVCVPKEKHLHQNINFVY